MEEQIRKDFFGLLESFWDEEEYGEKLNKENNMTIIMATHDLDEIANIKPRIIALAKTVKYDGNIESWKGL